MGLLDRLFRKESNAKEETPRVEVSEPRRQRYEVVDERDESKLPANAVLLGGQDRVEVKGESNYQDALDEICGGKCAEGHGRRVFVILQPEPENPYDPNAIALQMDGKTVGYLAKQAALEYAPIAKILSDKGKVGAARAYIKGGWRRGSDEGHYGVELELSSTEKLLKTRKITSLT